METVEVRPHEKTGEFSLVGNDGAIVFGPGAPHEILRQYRCAIDPHEDVLRIPCFFEIFRTFHNPHPLSEYTKHEIAWLPPSVTQEQVPGDIHAFIDWQPRLTRNQIEEAMRLASPQSSDAKIAIDGI